MLIAMCVQLHGVRRSQSPIDQLGSDPEIDFGRRRTKDQLFGQRPICRRFDPTIVVSTHAQGLLTPKS